MQHYLLVIEFLGLNMSNMVIGGHPSAALEDCLAGEFDHGFFNKTPGRKINGQHSVAYVGTQTVPGSMPFAIPVKRIFENIKELLPDQKVVVSWSCPGVKDFRNEMFTNW